MASKKQKNNIDNNIDHAAKNLKKTVNKPLIELKNENFKKTIIVNSEELMDEAKIKLSNLAEEAKKIWNK